MLVYVSLVSVSCCVALFEVRLSWVALGCFRVGSVGLSEVMLGWIR